MLHFLLEFWVFGLQERIFQSRLPDFVEEIIPELEVAAFLHEFDSVSGYALFVLVVGLFECEELDLHVEIAVLFVLLGRQTEVLLLKVGFDGESRVEAIDVVLAELLPDEAWFALDVKVGHVVELEGVEGSGGSLSDELEEILFASFDFSSPEEPVVLFSLLFCWSFSRMSCLVSFMEKDFCIHGWFLISSMVGLFLPS